MKNSKYILHIAILTALIYPTYTFASWWNPVSWFNWSYFKKEQTNTELLEKRIMELENKLNTSTSTNITTNKEIATTTGTDVKNPIIPTTTKKTRNVTNKEKITGVSSKDTSDMIDTWILNSKSFVDSINEYISYIDYYTESAKKSNDAVSVLINTETDQYLGKMWQYLSKIFGAIIQLGSELKNSTELKGGVYNLTLSVNNYLSTLEKKKSDIPKYFENDEVRIAESLKLINYNFDTAQDLLSLIYNAKKEYLDVIGLSMEKVSDTQPDIQSYMSRYKPGNINMINTTIYQPSVVIPQIQIPKTTYCTIRGTGVNGSYDVSCN